MPRSNTVPLATNNKEYKRILYARNKSKETLEFEKAIKKTPFYPIHPKFLLPTVRNKLYPELPIVSEAQEV